MRQLLTLRHYANRYVERHRCTKDSASNFHSRAASLSEFVGGDMLIKDLTADLVDEWLLSLKRQGIGDITLDSYKRKIITIWRYSRLRGDNQHEVPRPWPLPTLPIVQVAR